MFKFVIIISTSLLTACAGLNPNPDERSSDQAWTSGNYGHTFNTVLPNAQSGKPWVQSRLAIFYENGWCTKQDVRLAELWYKKTIAQKSSGNWAEGKLVGTSGQSGFFNQNNDARIAAFKLTQLYLKTNRHLADAHQLIKDVIRESNGNPVFFCCEFAQGRYFSQAQFTDLEDKIRNKLSNQ